MEFQACLARNVQSNGFEELRKEATLAYLAAGRLEKVFNIWIEEMTEEENLLLARKDGRSSLRYSAHAHAFVRGATKYGDADLKVNQSAEEGSTSSDGSSGLYERYFEYVDLLAAQGLIDIRALTSTS